jgi:uncharacterized protein with HEPN domain
MDNKKNDNYYALKALEHIKTIKKYIANKTYDEFILDDELIDAVMFRLIQLTENIKKLSNEFKERNSNVPWGKIIGFRNGIVHEYGKTDFTIVYETVCNDLDELIKVFEEVL